ncbi:hypothetical protein [Austwickia chelonae]|uniref:hypothetical protein n=1 Tax=Austwickia chelonae TaxID=100225 RepID=UPI001F07561A|nr:hypothetical protein [Austwickia chelonae]
MTSGRRPPTASTSPALCTTERDGYVWVWFGPAEPDYALPGPPLDDLGMVKFHKHFQLEDSVATSPRRILENTFDPNHLVALHGLTVRGGVASDLLDVTGAEALFGPADQPTARLGAVFSWSSYTGWLGRLSDLAGLNAERFELRVAAWPTLQHVWYLADGIQVYHLVLGVTPVAEEQSVQHISVAVRRNPGRAIDLLRYAIHRVEVTAAARQDLPIFNTIRSGDHHGIYVSGDRPLREFRRFYQRWVDQEGLDD